MNAAGDVTRRALDNNLLLNNALSQAPAIATPFPGTDLGRQLRMIATLISVRATLGLSR